MLFVPSMILLIPVERGRSLTLSPELLEEQPVASLNPFERRSDRELAGAPGLERCARRHIGASFILSAGS
jgi:hypothetical protein